MGLELEAQRLRVQKQQEEQAQVEEFLQKHGFAKLNSVKKLKTSFMRTKKCGPLHMAVELNDPELVKAMLRRGADKMLKNGKGQVPWELAKKLGQENPSAAEVIELLDPKVH